jgi:hypothetical protein
MSACVTSILFSPPREHIEVYHGILNAFAPGYKVLVIDSLSHAWRELTEEVDRITQASVSKNSLLSWGKVSPKQKRLVETILNFPGHLITTMRSKTEWVIGEGQNGKTTPQKIGLAPEQGKGIEYEFDVLMELNQQHHATITKDRTGKFQDETIERPGEEFGVSLYEWLSSGKTIVPAAPVQEEKPSAKTVKADVVTKPKTKTSAAPLGNTLKDQGDQVIQEIGVVITTVAKEGSPYFSEDEKEEARQIIKETKLNEKGLSDLREFKIFLSDELTKRKIKKPA